MPQSQLPKNTSKIMLVVIASCIPAVTVQSYVFGAGVVTNILFAILFSILIEALCLKLRGKEIITNLIDFSAIVTAILFAICLPPEFSIVKILIGLFFSIAIAKHCYGGLGHNIFNPAMVGYAILLIAFPVDFINWHPDSDIISNVAFGYDAISQATPLDPIYQDQNNYYLLNFYIINLSWLIMGLYLIHKKIIGYIIPLGVLLGLFFTASICLWFVDNIYQPWQHLLLGATMVGAFFIATDPVTAPVNNYGKFIFAVIIGSLCYIIREFGSYPDGVAFAVLFMNTWTPLINKLTIKSARIKR